MARRGQRNRSLHSRIAEPPTFKVKESKMSVILSSENRVSCRKPETKCFECHRGLNYPFVEWNGLFICAPMLPHHQTRIDGRHGAGGSRRRAARSRLSRADPHAQQLVPRQCGRAGGGICQTHDDGEIHGQTGFKMTKTTGGKSIISRHIEQLAPNSADLHLHHRRSFGYPAVRTGSLWRRPQRRLRRTPRPQLGDITTPRTGRAGRARASRRAPQTVSSLIVGAKTNAPRHR